MTVQSGEIVVEKSLHYGKSLQILFLQDAAHGGRN